MSYCGNRKIKEWQKMKTIKPGTRINLGFIPRSSRERINEQFRTFCGLYEDGYVVTVDSDRIDEFWDSFPELEKLVNEANKCEVFNG
jgi:hypothetical protein